MPFLRNMLLLGPIDNQQLLASNISTVIHSAATVKFDEPLPIALEQNINGTRRVLEICRNIKNLRSLVHISTAYSNCDQNIVEEKIYPPPSGADQVMSLLNEQTYEEGKCRELTRMIKQVRPNTYTYTKALTENVLSNEAKNLPICIVRPSIVTAALHEPEVGWIDNVNGPTGYFTGIGLGTLRVMAVDSLKVMNFIPVDMTASMILCAAWETAQKKPTLNCPMTPITIYNCCSSYKNPILMGKVIKGIVENVRNVSPFSKALFYPYVYPTTNKLVYNMHDLAFQYIPVVMHDVLFPSNKFSAVKYFKKVKALILVSKYFSLNEWRFVTDNTSRLYGKLTDQEKKNFFFDVDNINWTEYLKGYCQGIRKFLMKEDESTLPNAHARMRNLRRSNTQTKTVAAVIAGSTTAAVAMAIVIYF